MRTTLRRVAVVVLAAVVLARWVLHHREAASGASRGRPASAAAQPLPPLPPVAGAGDADVLVMGRLTLHACEIGSRRDTGLPTAGAYCTTLAVPEDWHAPRGRQIRLKVAIVKADTPEPAADVVTFLDGGPGGAATDDWPEVAPAFEPLRQRHDMLLIDQRGTGGSNALDCPQLQGAGDSPALPARADQPQTMIRLLQQCLAQLQGHAAPQFYTTTEAVRDLEAVREAVGGPRLDIVGISYGTRLAQQYAARYPDSVRSVVLDSAVPNSLALLSEHARNLEHALRLLFARCRAQPACAQRFPDPYATLYRVRDRLRAHPQLVQLRDPVSFQPLQLTLTAADLAAVVRFYAYSPLTAALLPLMLSAADQGNYAPLLGQKKWLADDLGDQITSGMELSVVCAEDADLLSPRVQDEDSLLGNDAIRQIKAACAVWPRGTRPAHFHSPWISPLPTLVLAGQFDPVTPPAYGRQIVRTLTSARLLIVPGAGHGVIGAGCMPRLVARFVDTLDAAALDASCLQRLGGVPAFLNYNGAGP